jgi:hypothetical protein
MCKVSDEIKLCTCADVELPDGLDNYWVLYRPTGKEVENILIGICAPPTSFRDRNFKLNERTILDRLNSGEAFDRPMEFRKNDKLEVVLKLGDLQEAFSYYFKFCGRKWMATKEDYFELATKFKEVKQGAVGLASTR